jgi:sodium/potassium-transporting ATPase subunit beta
MNYELMNFYNFYFILGKIITFYTIFYIVLAALFTICMAGLYYTLEDEKPKYLLTDSLITSNPGISFTPQDYESADETLQINIIDFNPSDKKSVRKWIDKLDRFFERGMNCVLSKTQ